MSEVAKVEFSPFFIYENRENGLLENICWGKTPTDFGRKTRPQKREAVYNVDKYFNMCDRQLGVKIYDDIFWTEGKAI